MSDTWDVSKVPPTQFQRRRGSILATPSSKDGNVERGNRDKAYFEKLKEKVSESCWNVVEGNERVADLEVGMGWEVARSHGVVIRL